jgi:hypothetical protein
MRKTMNRQSLSFLTHESPGKSYQFQKGEIVKTIADVLRQVDSTIHKLQALKDLGIHNDRTDDKPVATLEGFWYS